MELAANRKPNSDLTLRQDILNELAFDPNVDAKNIGVAVESGVVTLTGHVSSYPEQLAVVRAAQRVKGVRAIAQDIEVRLSRPAAMQKDDEIAARAVDALRRDNTVPSDSIQITVRDGLVTLTGNVYWHYQRIAAEENVRMLSGVVGVHNHITINPRAPAFYIAQEIENALKRNAEVEAEAIHVTVQDGGKVLLEGTVGNWTERDLAEQAAASAPGITSVENRLIIEAAHRLSPSR